MCGMEISSVLTMTAEKYPDTLLPPDVELNSITFENLKKFFFYDKGEKDGMDNKG